MENITPQEHYCSKCGVSMGAMNPQEWEAKKKICDACSGTLIKTPIAPQAPQAIASKKPSLAKIAAGEPMTDVWKLESNDEEFASDMLSQIANEAMKGDVSQQQYLSNLWDGESWESIQKKLQAEGSTWYVWWMDGVRKFMSQLDTQDVEEQAPQPDAIASCKSCLITPSKKKGKKGIGYSWMPKDKTHSGHMDTQMYPECEGTRYDRNIQNKATFNLSKFITEAKKKKKWNPNPWAVCTKSVGRDSDKYERCVKKVKKQQS